MDIKTFLDNIYEQACCPVCTNRFTNPKLLPCSHTFCLHCLLRIQETSRIRDSLLCPECRRNFTIPGNGDLNTLPTNFRLNSLLDSLPVTECTVRGSSVEIATKQDNNLPTASLVVRSGAMTVFLSITG